MEGWTMSLSEKGLEVFVKMISSWVKGDKEQVARIYWNAIRPMQQVVRSNIEYIRQECKFFESYDCRFSLSDPMEAVSDERNVALRAFLREQKDLANEIINYNRALDSLLKALQKIVNDAKSDAELHQELELIFEAHKKACLASGTRFYPQQMEQDLTSLLNRVIQGGEPGDSDGHFSIWKEHGDRFQEMITSGRRQPMWLMVVRWRKDVLDKGKALLEKFEAIEDVLYRQGALDDFLKQDAERSGGGGDIPDSFERPVLF